MAYCPKCGVKVERDQIPCPLCYTYIPEIISDEELAAVNGFPKYYSLYEDFRKNILRNVYNMFAILMILGLLVPIIIDVLSNQTMSWSRYSSLSVLTFWSFLSVAFGRIKTTKNKIIFPLVMVCVLLVGIDYFNGFAYWSFKIALPILAMVVFLVAVNVDLYRVRRSWFLRIGAILLSYVSLHLWIVFLVNGNLLSVPSIMLFIVGAAAIIIYYIIPQRWKELLRKKLHI